MNALLRIVVSIGIIILVTVVGMLVWRHPNTTTQHMPNPTPEKVTVISVEVQDLTETKKGDVYATLSNGETRLIAQSDGLESEKEYYYQVTYRKAFISPNAQFVAVQGMGFEDPFVQVYEVASNILHEETYGDFVGWTEENRIHIRACDLSGETCVDKVSTNPQTPWIFEEKR